MVRHRHVRSAAALALSFVAGVVLTSFCGDDAATLWAHVASETERARARASKDVAPHAEWKTEGFGVRPHAVGFDHPVRIALHPQRPRLPEDPFYYVAELPGHIRMVTLDGSVHTVAENLLDFEWQPSQELGLMGLEIDRGGDLLYVTMTSWDADDGAWKNRIEALTLQDGFVRRRELLLHIDEPTVASYGIQFVRLGPDDHLYVGIGAGGQPSDAQRLDKFAGKIIRLRKDGGAPEDNPFYDAADPSGARSYVFAYGLRNPWDIAWDPSSSTAVVSDVGPSVDRIVRLERGLNYLFGEGDGFGEGDRDGDSRMRANALYSWGPGGHFVPTGVAFAAAPAARVRSTAGDVQGSLLYVALFGAVRVPGPSDGKRLLRFAFAPSGHLGTGPEAVVRYVGPAFSTITDVVAAHDGIYFADIYGPDDRDRRGRGIIYRLQSLGVATASKHQPLAADTQDPARGEQLFTVEGCSACHDLTTASSGKEGPPLGELARRLDERLGSDAYEATLRELESRPGSYYAAHRPRYRALLETAPRQRARLWFGFHLVDPRFDRANSKMPAFSQLSEADVDALADFLLAR